MRAIRDAINPDLPRIAARWPRRCDAGRLIHGSRGCVLARGVAGAHLMSWKLCPTARLMMIARAS